MSELRQIRPEPRSDPLQAQAFPSVEVSPLSEASERVYDAFRRWGYLEANLDPLGHFKPVSHSELQATGSDADAARVISPTRGFQPSHSYALSAT